MRRKLLTAAMLCAIIALPATALTQSADQRTRLDREVSGGYLGVTLGPVTDERAKELKLANTKGALVTRVLPDSPAASAGLKTNDVIVSINGKEFGTSDELIDLIHGYSEGQQVTLEVVRAGKRERLTPTLGKRPAFPRGGVWRIDPDAFDFGQFQFPDDLMSGRGVQIFGGRSRLGVTLLPLTDQLREHFGVEAGKGALVSSVTKGSPAERAGLRAGDVILSVDGREVSRTGDVASALREAGEGTRTVQIEVVRNRARQTVSATVEEARPLNEE